LTNCFAIGQSAALLNLFYILHSCKAKFFADISKYNYCSSFIEMLLLEARQAAILIQHTFRVHKMKRLKINYDPVLASFGSELEARSYRRSYQNARNFELRLNWREMHWKLMPQERLQFGGVRGPAHIPNKYILLGLEIALQLGCTAQFRTNIPNFLFLFRYVFSARIQR
jgi:hypothetical protein